MGLKLDDDSRALSVTCDDRPLVCYVYRPGDPQLESPRPYFHPVRTLQGDLVSLFRPHDHVWHKGVAWSLPNVGPANFWGGTTFLRGRGYEQLPNNGSMRHRAFTSLDAGPSSVRVAEDLDWITQQGQVWFRERRCFTVALCDRGWLLTFATSFTNVTSSEIALGSPTTEGRDNAGYGGLFWRGPRSFTGGRVLVPSSQAADGEDPRTFGEGARILEPDNSTIPENARILGEGAEGGGVRILGPDGSTNPEGARILGEGGSAQRVVVGGDELMGCRAPWMGFTGRHDGSGRESTLVFVDAPGNPGHPTQWFVRSDMYACLCPAPFFSTTRNVSPGEGLTVRYAMVVADGRPDPVPLAAAGLAALSGKDT